MAQQTKRIDGHTARLMAVAMAHVQGLDEEIARLVRERQGLAAALHGMAEERAGGPLPEPARLVVDGDEVVVVWDGGELAV